MPTVTLTVGTGTQQWTPAGDQVGATITLIELWGPGGSGTKDVSGRGTGGGAGAYNPVTVSVTVASLLVGGTVPYQTGRGGAAVTANTTAGNPGTAKTWFSAIGTYAADFGLGGNRGGGSLAGGAGGLVANCVPTTDAVAGGSGGTCSNANGASGGGASGSSGGAGVNAAAVSTAIAGAGATAPAGGGNGGAASITAAVSATSGSSPGGGGGAMHGSSTGNSGAGADGQIILTYTPAAGASITVDATASIEWLLLQYAPPVRNRSGAGPRPLIARSTPAFIPALFVDSATPVDWSAPTFFDNITPIESLTSRVEDSSYLIDRQATVLFDASDAVELSPIVLSIGGIPIEWRIAFISDVLSPAGWQTSILGDSYTALAEWSASSVRDSTAPIEWSLSAIRDSIVVAEWRNAFTRDTSLPVEWSLSAVGDSTTSIELSLSAIGNLLTPIDWSSSLLRRDDTTPIEMRLTVTPQDIVTPVEWLKSTFGILADTPDPIEWRSSFTQNIYAPSEWNFTLLPQDILSPIDWRSSTVSDAEEIAEWTSSSLGVSGDASEPVEWRSSPIRDAIVPTEWRSLFTIDALSSIEWPLSALLDTGGIIEWGVLVPQDFLSPTEWRASYAINAGAPIEVLASSSINASNLSEWRLTFVYEPPIATEWRSTFSVDAPSLTAWSATPRSDAAAPTEWLIQASTVNFIFPVEPNTTGQINPQTQVDWAALISPSNSTIALETPAGAGQGVVFPDATWLTAYHDEIVGINWTGPIGVILDTGNPIEWRAAPFLDSILPISEDTTAAQTSIVPVNWLASSFLDNLSSLEASATSIINVTTPIAWSTIMFVITTPIVIDWIIPTTSDTTSPAFWLSGRSRDTSPAIDVNAALITSVTPPIEYGGATGIIEDVLSGVEFRAGRVIDAATPTTWFMPAQIDASITASWQTTIVPDNISVPGEWSVTAASNNIISEDWSRGLALNVPIIVEFSGALGTAVRDATAPIEINAIALSSVSVESEWQFVPLRFTKGATIQVAHKSAVVGPIVEGSGTKGSTLER